MDRAPSVGYLTSVVHVAGHDYQNRPTKRLSRPHSVNCGSPMELPANPFKHAIAAGRQQIGLWVSLASAYSAEIVAGAGVDWLVIDTEHSPNEGDTPPPQLQVVAAYPRSASARPAWEDKGLIK